MALRCFFTHGRSADILKVSQTMGKISSTISFSYKVQHTIFSNPTNLVFAMNLVV